MQLAFIFDVALAIFDRYGWIYCHSIDLCLISWPTYHTYKKKRKKNFFFDISLCKWMCFVNHIQILHWLCWDICMLPLQFIMRLWQIDRHYIDLWMIFEKHVTHMNFHFFIWTYLYANTSAFCKPPTNNGDFSVSDGPCPTNASFSGHTPGAGTHRGRLSKPRLVPRLQVVATNKLPPPVHILKVPCYVIRRFWRTSLTKQMCNLLGHVPGAVFYWGRPNKSLFVEWFLVVAENELPHPGHTCTHTHIRYQPWRRPWYNFCNFRSFVLTRPSLERPFNALSRNVPYI